MVINYATRSKENWMKVLENIASDLEQIIVDASIGNTHRPTILFCGCDPRLKKRGFYASMLDRMSIKEIIFKCWITNLVFS